MFSIILKQWKSLQNEKIRENKSQENINFLAKRLEGLDQPRVWTKF